LAVCTLARNTKPTSIKQSVALAAVDTFGVLVAAYIADAVRPDGLAVDEARARMRIAQSGNTA
jgi:hypothetical protein